MLVRIREIRMGDRTSFRRAVRRPRAEITRAIGARKATPRIAARLQRVSAARTTLPTVAMRQGDPTIVHPGLVRAMRPTPATAVRIRRSKAMRVPTIGPIRRNLEAIRRRAVPTLRRQRAPIPRLAALTLRLAAAMEVVAARRTAGVAVQLRTAAVAVALRTAAGVVVAEADRIVDPETFPKGPPISSRRAFSFWGP